MVPAGAEQRWAAIVETAKLNDINPQAWLTDVLARLPDHPAKRIADLLPSKLVLAKCRRR
jgi:hypothetical protein